MNQDRTADAPDPGAGHPPIPDEVTSRLVALDPLQPGQDFPPVDSALHEPDGLLAVGGCLSAQRLLNAYRRGIFPWFSAQGPIYWWSPRRRLVLFPEKLVVYRSLRQSIRKRRFSVTFDTAFEDVVQACAAPRPKSPARWLHPAMQEAYVTLHRAGQAHSAETWCDAELAGGLYGVSFGQVFSAESMFYRVADASKAALLVLVEHLKDWGYRLFDCQVHSPHFVAWGAEEIDRDLYVELLATYGALPPGPAAWRSH